MNMKTGHGLAAALALASAGFAAPVLPGYLTDPSAVRAGIAADASYRPPEALRFPYLSTYYVQPVVRAGENVTVGFFVTDFDSSKVRFLDDTHQFAAFLEVRPKGTEAWKCYVLKKLRSGDHAFSLGALPPGDYEMRTWAIDRRRRESHRVLHDFRVVADTAPDASRAYEMTAADLAAYGVRNDGDLSTVLWEGTNGTRVVRRKNPKRPGYTVRVPLKGERPVFRSYQSAKIAYDEGYDAAAVERESVANAEGLQRLIDEKAAAGVRVFRMLPGTYRLSATRKLLMPDDFTLDLNGATLKQNGFTGCHSVLVEFPSARNARLTNGTLEGDYYEHDYANSPNGSEWPMGFNFCGACEYCTVEKVRVVDVTGYGAGNGIGKDRRGGLHHVYQGLGGFRAGGLDPRTGEVDATDAARFTTDFVSLAKVKGQGRVQVSKYLGYQGRATRSWQLTVCWYDDAKRFVSSETCWQYREMFIPAKAEFLRVSVEEASEASANGCGLALARFRVPTNCTVKDCTFERCRCVGYAASALKNMLFEGNFFTASGESSAKCAFDAEDGWDQMQDALFRRNVFRDNPVNNSILTCCGHNFVLEENDCDIHFWGRTHSPCVRGNVVGSASFGCDSRLRSGYGRFENNRYRGPVELGRADAGSRVDNWDFVISGLEVDGAKGEKAPSISTGPGGRLVACTFRDVTARVGNAYACRFENCTGDFYPGGRWQSTTATNCQFRYFYGTNLFADCQLADVRLQGFRGGRFTVRGGTFDRCVFQNLDTCDISFEKTAVRDCAIRSGYWEKPGKLTFDRCRITTSAADPLVKTALYTIGTFSFSRCTIDGARELVHVSDLRPQPTDGLPGRIELRACDWKASPQAVTRSSGDVSPKRLALVDERNAWRKGTAMAGADLPPTWTLEQRRK